MSEATQWRPATVYVTEVDHEDPEYPLIWASVSADSGGTAYHRADIPPPLSAALAHPHVAALVEALAPLAALPLHGIHGGPFVTTYLSYEDGTTEKSARFKGTLEKHHITDARAALAAIREAGE